MDYVFVFVGLCVPGRDLATAIMGSPLRTSSASRPNAWEQRASGYRTKRAEPARSTLYAQARPARTYFTRNDTTSCAQATCFHGEDAIDDTSVYWTDYTAAMKVPLGGGHPVTLTDTYGQARGIAADSTSVYWVDAQGGARL